MSYPELTGGHPGAAERLGRGSGYRGRRGIHGLRRPSLALAETREREGRDG